MRERPARCPPNPCPRRGQESRREDPGCVPHLPDPQLARLGRPYGAGAKRSSPTSSRSTRTKSPPRPSAASSSANAASHSVTEIVRTTGCGCSPPAEISRPDPDRIGEETPNHLRDVLRTTAASVAPLAECGPHIARRRTQFAPKRGMRHIQSSGGCTSPLCQTDSESPCTLLEGWLATFEYFANLITHGRVLETTAQI